MKKLIHMGWLLFRNIFVGAYVTVAFPTLIATFYVVASALGGHLNDDKGDMVLTLPFAGVTFLIAVFLVAVFLFPAMCVADGFHFFRKMRSRMTLFPGIAFILLLYLPLQLTAANGFSWHSYGLGSLFFVVLFFFYWTFCVTLDFVGGRILCIIKQYSTNKNTSIHPLLSRL